MGWFTKKVGAKIYNYGARKYREAKENRRQEHEFHQQERATYKQAEHAGRLKRAKHEGYESGATRPQSRVKRAARYIPSIRTDGPDPFGLFANNQSRLARQAPRRSTGKKKKQAIRNNYWDNLP